MPVSFVSKVFRPKSTLGREVELSDRECEGVEVGPEPAIASKWVVRLPRTEGNGKHVRQAYLNPISKM